MEPEVPQIRIVVVRFPSLDAGKKRVHDLELLYFARVHRGIGVRHHEPMSWPTTLTFTIPSDLASA